MFPSNDGIFRIKSERPFKSQEKKFKEPLAARPVEPGRNPDNNPLNIDRKHLPMLRGAIETSLANEANWETDLSQLEDFRP
jgi:hypothetical protein